MPGRRIEGHRNRSIVLYGRSGTGKTTLAATWPKPILFLDCRDEGTDSISDVDGIEAREIDCFEDIELMYWWLVKNPDRFKTVVIDTVSQLQNMLIKEVTPKGKHPGDWGTLTKRDWGNISADMKEWLINYRDLSRLGIDPVFIAQDRVFNFDEEDGAVAGEIDPEVGPQLMPSVAKVLNASVHVIGNTFIRTVHQTVEVRGKKKTRDKTEYCLRIGPNPVYITKVRKPRSISAPTFIVDPTYEDVMSIIKGE